MSAAETRSSECLATNHTYVVQHAKELMSAAESRGAFTFNFQEVQKRIARDLTACEKDNEFIYHSRVPDVTALASIGKAAVAKCTPLVTPLSGAQFKGRRHLSVRHGYIDLVEKVVPPAVQ